MDLFKKNFYLTIGENLLLNYYKTSQMEKVLSFLKDKLFVLESHRFSPINIAVNC